MNIITFKWKKPGKTPAGLKGIKYRLTTPVEYTSVHVNILYHSVKRNTSLPINFYCVTDDPSGLDENITALPHWGYGQVAGGCFNRLFLYSEEIIPRIGTDKFLMLDLDVVITGNIDHILNREEDFVINSFTEGTDFEQLYNGGVQLLKPGSRVSVWETFKTNMYDVHTVLKPLRDQKKLVGSDQAWIQYHLGKNEARFTPENDGIYEYNKIKGKLPDNCCMVLFPGRTDPSLKSHQVDWVRKHWRT